MLESAVAVSRKWGAYEAGEEVAGNALAGLSAKPKFVLLFTTIHYQKHGGFQKLLDGVHSKLPEGTPLVGGTVAGFMNSSGCYTRGTAMLAVYDEKMDVVVAAGKNTKRKPTFSARDCARSLRNSLAGSRHPNKNFFAMVSSAIVPNVPLIGGKKVIRRFPGINIAARLLSVAYSALQIGPGRDDEIFRSFCNELEGWGGIGGASCDALRLEQNWQFLNKSVLTNSIVALGMATENKVKVETHLGMKPSGRKFRASEVSAGGYVIGKINRKPAVSEYLRIMGWDASVLDERLYRKVFYYPFISMAAPVLEPRMFGLVYGESFVCPMRISAGTDYEVWTSTGSDLLNSTSGIGADGVSSTGILVSCGTRLETLGSAVFRIADRLKNRFRNDFLLVYVAGEYAKSSEGKPACLYQSDNALLFK